MMRFSGCTIQQDLTQEAAEMVKQAVDTAKRRCHAQVTPLHVVDTMLSSSSPSGLFRAACMRSHSHPLRYRALQCFFNVALNRLPTSTSSCMLGRHSNALVATFKRAQAHQRRGSIKTQQQPLLAVKIGLKQLIMSILDDPSVSRIMQEVGFIIPLVKEKVEQSVSLEVNTSDQLNVGVNPSLEAIWGIHSIMIPASGSLGSSLAPESCCGSRLLGMASPGAIDINDVDFYAKLRAQMYRQPRDFDLNLPPTDENQVKYKHDFDLNLLPDEAFGLLNFNTCDFMRDFDLNKRYIEVGQLH